MAELLEHALAMDPGHVPSLFVGVNTPHTALTLSANNPQQDSEPRFKLPANLVGRLSQHTRASLARVFVTLHVCILA